MKPIEFMGNTLNTIKSFPEIIKRETGYQLDRIQRGLDPLDWKPMSSIGLGVREIRIKQQGQFRIIYIAKFDTAIYVLHAFSKKTQKTNQQDLEMAKDALKKLLKRKTVS